MKDRADLHIHTIASDGALTPAQVVEAAYSIGLGAIAITDHDTVDGIDEALSAGKRLGVEIIPGIEISTIYGSGDVEAHILGYFIDHKDPELLSHLHILKSARLDRAKRMVELLNKVGVAVSYDRVLEIARGGAVGRPHVAKAIREIGAASSMDAAFGRFLVPGCPAFVPRYKLTPIEAVQIIRKAGGVACCAHVAKLKRDELVVDLIEHGLAAIEVYHPDHNSVGMKFYEKFAKKRDLIATGGSDAHCFEGNKYAAIGDVTVSRDVVGQLKEKLLQ